MINMDEQNFSSKIINGDNKATDGELVTPLSCLFHVANKSQVQALMLMVTRGFLFESLLKGRTEEPCGKISDHNNLKLN